MWDLPGPGLKPVSPCCMNWLTPAVWTVTDSVKEKLRFFLCRKKTHFLPTVFLSYVSPLLFTQNASLLTLLVPNTWRFSSTAGSSLQCQLLSCKLTQFWHCLPGDTIGSHRLRAQSHMIPPPVPQNTHTLQTPVASPGYHLSFWPTDYRWEVPKTPSLGLINLLE